MRQTFVHHTFPGAHLASSDRRAQTDTILSVERTNDFSPSHCGEVSYFTYKRNFDGPLRGLEALGILFEMAIVWQSFDFEHKEHSLVKITKFLMSEACAKLTD